VPISRVNIFFSECIYQIENEYGSYQACDSNYTTRLRDIVKSIVGDAAVLYSTDGAGLSYLRCGKIEGVYATVDFGAGNKLFSCFFMLRFTISV
jgi:beta-galactosidase